MLPKLIAYVGVLLRLGELAMDAYVRIRKVFPARKGRKLTSAEMRRWEELACMSGVLTRDMQDELLELQERYRLSRER